jgi:hypothetical protein
MRCLRRPRASADGAGAALTSTLGCRNQPACCAGGSRKLGRLRIREPMEVEVTEPGGQSMPSMMRKSRSTPSERATSASW